MSRVSIALVLAACLASGCGARTDLSLERTDAAPVQPPRDAGVDAPTLDPPDCGVEVAIGTMRGQVLGIHSRPAIDDLGNLYALRRADDDGLIWSLVSLDPCLRERWITPIAGEVRGLRRGRVMVDARGDVWVVARGPSAAWRFTSEGTPLELGVDIDSTLFTWIGVPDEGGPVFVTDGDAGRQLRRVDRAGAMRSLALPEETTFVWDGECVALADTIGCADVAFDRDAVSQLWRSPTHRLLDGTFRHALPPATDGTLSYIVEYGISTYQLRIRETRTGSDRIVVPLARTTRGQTSLLIGPPVLTETGRVVLYLSAHRADGVMGQLEAFTADGTRAWTFPAPRARRREDSYDGIFSGEATHVAGRGELYLAVGTSVYAIDERSGELVWQLDGLGDVNEPGTNLSPNGDLFVRDVMGVLTAIPTASRGPARAPWPIPGGSHRLHRAN